MSFAFRSFGASARVTVYIVSNKCLLLAHLNASRAFHVIKLALWPMSIFTMLSNRRLLHEIQKIALCTCFHLSESGPIVIFFLPLSILVNPLSLRLHHLHICALLHYFILMKYAVHCATCIIR